jgi:two-component system chemotaxis response regulator CheB
MQSGTVYIAPPNNHLLINPDGIISLTQSELVHFVRPSADLLFESVAASYKDRAIAVVLTGSGSDGNLGVRAIKKMGGTVIAQDEASSEFYGMPGAAIQTGSVDFILPLEEIAPALVTLVMTGNVNDKET